MAEPEKKTTTTITRSVRVEFDQAHLYELLRKACGAPDNAYVEIDYTDATVTWSTVEEQ